MADMNDGFSVSDMLFLIGFQSRTGELVVESGNNIGSILTHQGAVLQAYSPYSRAIGDLMVENGIITEAELFEALDQQKKNLNIPIGTLLLQTGKVTFALIEKMVHNQIRSSIQDFNSWENIHFSFISKEVTPFDKIRLPVHEFVHPDTFKTASEFLQKPAAGAEAVHFPAKHYPSAPVGEK